MHRKEKTGNGILRLIFVAVALLIQILWILLRIQYLNAYSDRIAAITAIATAAAWSSIPAFKTVFNRFLLF